MQISINKSAMMSECRTYLVYHIDKGLCVVPEAMDRVTSILTRDDRLDQGGEFIQGERASDQTSTDWSEVEKQERIWE
jgi:hypothetical protein